MNRILAEEGLTDAQRLYLGVGLAQLGDFTGAERVYASLSGKLKSESGMKYLDPDGTRESRLAATGAALMRYLCVPENDRNRTDRSVTDLEMLCYLERFTVPTGGAAARFAYTLDGERREITLSEPAWHSASLSAETLAAGLETLSGEVKACVRYVDYADASVPAGESPVTITKT